MPEPGLAAFRPRGLAGFEPPDELMPLPRNPAHMIDPQSRFGQALGHLLMRPVDMAADAIRGPRRAYEGYYSGASDTAGAPQGADEAQEAMIRDALRGLDLGMTGRLPFASPNTVGVFGGRAPSVGAAPKSSTDEALAAISSALAVHPGAKTPSPPLPPMTHEAVMNLINEALGSPRARLKTTDTGMGLIKDAGRTWGLR